MENLLVNLAVIKVNSDKSAGILDNYIPVFAFCLKQVKGDLASSAELQSLFEAVTDIKVPQAVILSLIKRSSKRYGYLEHTKDQTYKINKLKLPEGQYEAIHEAEVRSFNQLREKFITYCRDSLNILISADEAENGFFETLYDFAPQLYRSVARNSALIHDQDREKLLVSKFVKHCGEFDSDAIDVIESFVRGAMLTEVFYYSDPDRVEASLKNIKVFFDTEFLIRALQLCDPQTSRLSLELIEILKSMKTQMRCFRDTLNELDGILHAAQTARTNGRLRCKRPGDVFDFYSKSGASVSDIQMDRSSVERKLSSLGITVEERPSHTRELGLDETGLSAKLDQHLSQSAEARKHDIDCATAIHRLRKGRAQNYLESCEAIFITPNYNLAQGLTEYFKEIQGRSDVSICMADQVFTTLVWIKAVKKKPLQPAKLIVANCIASLRPSQEDWARYIGEIEKLEAKGDITEDDYYLLVHSNEARAMLVDSIVQKGVHVVGNPKEVLERIRESITHDLEKELTDTNNRLRVLSDGFGKVKLALYRGYVFFSCLMALIAFAYIWLVANREAVYVDVWENPISAGAGYAYFIFFWTIIGASLQATIVRLLKRYSQVFAEATVNKLMD